MNYRLIPRLALSCSLAGLFLLFATTFSVHAAAADPPLMRLDPSSQTVDVGSGTFTVSVMIDNVSNLGSYEFELGYDPQVVRFVSVEDGGFLGSTQRRLQCPTATLISPAEDELPNKVHFGCSTLDPTPAGPSGSGRLAVVTLAPVASGYSDLTLIATSHDTGTSDVSSDNLNAVSQNGSVTVTGDSPTATPDPDEPTAVPTQIYIPYVYVTPTPGGDAIFTPQPGETPMTRPMPGRDMDGSSAGALAAASDPAGVSRAAGASGSSGSNGSPHAGTGPEQQKSSWPALAGGLLVAAGAGLLFLSFYLKRIPARRNDDPKT